MLSELKREIKALENLNAVDDLIVLSTVNQTIMESFLDEENYDLGDLSIDNVDDYEAMERLIQDIPEYNDEDDIEAKVKLLTESL